MPFNQTIFESAFSESNGEVNGPETARTPLSATNENVKYLQQVRSNNKNGSKTTPSPQQVRPLPYIVGTPPTTPDKRKRKSGIYTDLPKKDRLIEFEKESC